MTENEPPVFAEPLLIQGKKRGRPVKKGDKEWQDDEIDTLIELWGKYECLFNSKHHLYMNKNERAKAMDKIIEALKKDNIEATTKQIQEKLTKLRNYYGAERRKEESSKVSGKGTDSVYTSSWRFYESLHFLKDNLTPRPSTNNIDEGIEYGVYQIDNPPSAKSARKLREKSRENAESVMAKASKALETITNRYQNAPQEDKSQEIKNKKGEDGFFADMVYEMLSTIPNCIQKAMAKIEFQQKLTQLKYSTVTAAPTSINYFPMQPFQGLSHTFSQQGSVPSSSHSGGSMPLQQVFANTLQGNSTSSTHSSGSSTSTPLSFPVYPQF